MKRRLAGPLLVLLLGACAAAAPAVRKVTYAPDLRYLAGRQVSEVMSALAKAAVDLDGLLREDAAPKEGVDVRAEVIRLLQVMESAASDLDAGPTTNHPVLDENLGLFRADLAAAREAAEVDPPNYFLAGSVAGSCLLYCHTGDRAGKRR